MLISHQANTISLLEIMVKPQSGIHDSVHYSRRFEQDGKIEVHRNGKKENPASILCLTMLLRCLHDLSTVPLRFMTAALLFTTVELRMHTMRLRFDTVLVLFKPVVPRHPSRAVFLMNHYDTA